MYSFTSRYRYPEKGGPFPSRKQPNRGHPTSNQASFLQRLAIFLLFFLWYHTAPIGGSDTASYLQSSLSGFAPGGLRAVFRSSFMPGGLRTALRLLHSCQAASTPSSGLYSRQAASSPSSGSSPTLGHAPSRGGG